VKHVAASSVSEPGYPKSGEVYVVMYDCPRCAAMKATCNIREARYEAGRGRISASGATDAKMLKVR